MSNIYEVRNSDMLDSHPPRLIRADSQAQVRRHIQKPYEIEVVNTDRALDLVQNRGVVVETAE